MESKYLPFEVPYKRDDLLELLLEPLEGLMTSHKTNFDELIAEMAGVMANARKIPKYAGVWKKDNPEAKYYAPFMAMVSSALRIAKEKLSNENLFPNLQKGYAWDLSFLEYDRCVQNQYGDDDLKLDGLGMIGVSALEAQTRVRWNDMHAIYEAKKGIRPRSGMIQTATYARKIFAHQANRTLVHALLHLCPNQVYLARYDREGCTLLERGMDISRITGQRDLSKTLVAMLLLPPMYSGIDETMSPDGLTFTLHNYVCDVTSTLTYRECLLGHATRAYLVKARERREFSGNMGSAMYAPVKLAESISEGDSKGGECCEGRVDERLNRYSNEIDRPIDPAVEDVQLEALPSQLPPIQGGRVSQATGSSFYSPVACQAHGVHDHAREFPSIGAKRSIGTIEGSNASTKKSKKRKKASQVQVQVKTRPQTERGKEWNALFVPVENFEDRNMDKPFIVKESYVFDYGLENQDMEGRAITEIRKARNMVKEVTNSEDAAIAGDDPLLASLCDYGSRVSVKGVGHIGRNGAQKEHGKAGPSKRKGKRKNKRKGTKRIPQDDRASAQDGERNKEGEASNAKVDDKQDGEKIGPVNITTHLDNSESKENRTLVRQVIYSVGEPLVSADSPKELVGAIRGILHGLYNLAQLGFVHRDVSTGNCFLTKNHVGALLGNCERDENTNELLSVEVKRFIESTGLLSDMDRAILISDTARKASAHRTGTVPFMAIFICENAEARHSPVHDCESTFWLIVWVIAFIAKKVTKKEALKAELETFIGHLRATTFESSVYGKRTLLCYFLAAKPWFLPSPFHPFIPLLNQMANEVINYDRYSNSHKDITFTKEQIRSCVALYMRAIDNNPLTQDDWTYIDADERTPVETAEAYLDL